MKLQVTEIVRMTLKVFIYIRYKHYLKKSNALLQHALELVRNLVAHGDARRGSEGETGERSG